MITLLLGADSALHCHCAELIARAPHHLPLAPGYAPRSWNGVRNLVQRLIAHRGRPPVLAVLARQRAAANLALGWFDGELTAAERDESWQLAARRESHLSHNLLIQRPLFSCWAGLLHELCTGVTLVVPHLARLDRESLAALRALYRDFPGSAPDLVAGFDPERPAPVPDGDGLLWEQPVEDVWRVMLGLRALPGTAVCELPRQPGSASETADAPALLPEAGPAADERAWAALGAAAEGADGALCDQVVAGMQAAFAAFGFTTALRLGLALLAREPQLDAAQAAEVHGIVGLAAHNRQFRTQDNLDLARFLEHHFRAALAAEPADAAARRSCLAYRLAVTLGRRQRRLDSALEWAASALAEAERPGLPPAQAAHLQGWARNIRAYVLLRADRPAAAAADCHAAFAALDAILDQHPRAAVDPDQLIREVAFTHSLLADNLAALASLSGDTAELQHWKRRADHLAEDFPELERFEALTWIRLYRELRRLEPALAKALSGARSAAAASDVLRWYSYLVQAADLHDRLGQPAAAWEQFERAEQLRHRLGDPPFLRPVDVRCAAAAARAGRFDEARQRLEAALAAQPAAAADARAQLLAALGELAARAGQAVAAEQRINDAIALAVDSGERDTLLTVALAAARSSQLLGRAADAAAAYRQALEIAATPAVDAAALPPPPAALLAVLLGLAEHSANAADQAAWIRRALLALPAALDDPDAWWDLPRLLAQVHLAARAEPDLLADAELAEPLALLLRAAEQRSDGCAGVAAVRELG